MAAVQLSLKDKDLPDNLYGVMDAIEKTVPVGFNKHQPSKYRSVKFDKSTIDLSILRFIDEKHPGIASRRKDKLEDVIISQHGTLGGGNHFIELCLDERSNVWLMLHSGSRGIGNVIAQYFIELARQDMKTHHINLPDNDLAYLSEGTINFSDYMLAVMWAQDYARANRDRMVHNILAVLDDIFPPFEIRQQAINCHHNYVTREHHFDRNLLITRKGAVRARKGDMGIIPGSMGAKSFIVRGLGNVQSFDSCSHGAGRVMSRKQAKRDITIEDHVKATHGVACRKDSGVLDESPAAYKDIDAVMAAQSDLVEIVATLKQVVCVKG